ncbi:hypothetical protein INT47_003555 [Mucor saturninus]|uniref:Pseudouridine synthase I TruA alpha/beta domain-containing protein n=1 Tax=Mucor saturninus TaxID=64648 RepID=A0A8H7UTC9_9FUNG|nr:hypothetical protein INT47_003555 [Mucor saturninus]
MLRRLFTTSRAWTNKEHYLKANAWHHDPDHVVSTEKRLPKKKVALMLGYNGSGYQGMQANPGIRSIEEEVFNALVKTDAISPSNASDPKKVQLMRAARTDKGVHAACNLVSLKMICQDEHLVENLNRVLPNHIRIWGYVETQRTFHAKTKCDSRVYEYLLPSYTLNAFERKEWTLEPSSDKDYMTRTEHGAVTKYIAPTDPHVLKAYRVDTPSFDKFKQAMELFQGTHNFHNYTIAKPFADPSCKRFMMNISVDEPMMIEGMEWISVKLHGQSFMLHQIRKMITMAMYSVRTNTPLSFLETTFDATKINIPKAPALGLLLDRPVFGLYNERIKDIPNRSRIDFSLYADAITQFKKQYIYKQIFAQEMAEQTFDRFLASIDSHLDTSYGYFSSFKGDTH